MFQIYDTASKHIVPIPDRSVITMYTCGPTVYGRAHVGNLRTIVSSDMLRRAISFATGKQVQWTMNITDIDDKILRLAREQNDGEVSEIGVRTFTQQYEKLFFDDISLLNVPRESFAHIPHALDAIDQMQQMIRQIYDNAYAYIHQGSVYFDTAKWRHNHRYGILKQLDFDTMESGHRNLSDEYEVASIGDFALWKAADTDSELSWPLLIGGEVVHGRPGWHIECSAMQQACNGDVYDIHSGGVDLAFPHHENEIAQTQCALNRDTARIWWHCEHLTFDGNKMSKSKGNITTLPDVLDQGFTAEDLRMLYVTSDPLKKLSFTPLSLEHARQSISSIRKRIGDDSLYLDTDTPESENYRQSLRDQIVLELSRNMALPRVAALIHELAESIRTQSVVRSPQTLQLVTEIESLLGIGLFAANDQRQTAPAAVSELADARQQARLNMDYALADTLRQQIQNLGYLVEDTAEGYQLITLSQSPVYAVGD